MINLGGFGAMASMALVLVLAEPTNGLAQYKVNERATERAIVPPRPPMRTQPGVIVGPIASPTRSATPVSPPVANRFGDHDHDHDHDGGAFAAGVAAGIVLGGATAAPGIYYAPAPSPADDPVAYCMQTYSSYDPQSGTYIGNDGDPHPCP
jgi:BA14K-like protein